MNNKLMLFFLLLVCFNLNAQSSFPAGTFNGLSWRSIGPAITGGRISDFAVNPKNSSEYYVAVASGGVWKTTNKGLTYEPVFDGEGSYSIGCVSLDPNNSNTVWVGTGENNNQRSVAYGDGVYKSEDGGRSWKNMGLKNSEHIAKIIIDPSNSNIIYVAAYGPVWSEGGERGVYKSTDGGATWSLIKSVSAYTGCNDLIMDPRNPKILYAAFHQRMRKVFTYIGGGPETALFKTMDGGATWKKMEGGLPGGDLGRIGIALAQTNPDIVYAMVEAKDDKGGIYRSTNQGASWEKRSGTFTSGNYYQELFVDPHDANKIYITDTYFKVSKDGGKTVGNLGEINKHVDNHAIWVDPKDPNHFLVGCDGGIYESYDQAQTWEFKSNLPIVQFYKVSTDNAFPFYNVHGGTQDNMSLGGPSRTTNSNGISNSDWFYTSTGDGFETQVDQSDPNIIYAQSQYGGLVRYDHSNGEYLFIKPIEGENEEGYRWNWDSPLLISQFSNSRLYFGANKIFRTDDQGNSWTAISPDLSRQIDRNSLEVMGKVWSVDAVAKNGSTDIYGQTTSIAESKFNENTLWVGTDDGLIQLTTDGGKNWTKIDGINGVPNQSYVHQIISSLHDSKTAYVCFNHHRYGDFKPYLLKTTDMGKTWKSVAGDLPQRGSVYSIAEDHVDPNLLFAGTEFGIYFSLNGGLNWTALKSGLPTIAVRDIEIQRRENDLVIATFGRSFYILEDYSLLRKLKPEDLKQEAKLFSNKPAWMYVERSSLGLRDKGHMGSGYYAAANPTPGVVINYFYRDEIKSRKELRKDLEKSKMEKNEKINYPPMDSLREEDWDQESYLLFTIKDEQGDIVRTLKTKAKKGIQRIVWNMRASNPAPIANRRSLDPQFLFDGLEEGHLVMPGKYYVSLSKFTNGTLTELAGPQEIECKLLPQGKLQAKDLSSNVSFYKQVTEMRKKMALVEASFSDQNARVAELKQAALDLSSNPKETLEQLFQLTRSLKKIGLNLYGDDTKSKREFETAPSITNRIYTIIGSVWSSTSTVPKMYKDSYQIANKQLNAVTDQLKVLDQQIGAIEQSFNIKQAPATKGRKPW